MIDFRYHIVTIVSIFLALAVGILLGAGPLQAGIGEALEQSVTNLRQDKSVLNAQLSTAESDLRTARQYGSEVEGLVVAGRLPGVKVAVLVLPNADAGVAAGVERSLGRSGAVLTGTFTLAPGWFDGTTQERDAVAERADAALGEHSPGSAAQTPAGGALDAALVRILVAPGRAVPGGPATTAAQPSPGATQTGSGEPSGQPAPSATETGAGPSGQATTATPGAPPPPVGTEAAADALAVLVGEDLVASSTPTPAAADAVVVVSGAWSGSPQVVDARTAAVMPLLSALAARSAATLVAGDVPSAPAAPDALQVTSDAVTALRANGDLRRELSSVDHAGEGRGPAIVVLALADELAGQRGHYGISAGADAGMPEVTP